MKFTTVALVALAAGAQAGAFKQGEPDAHDKAMHQKTNPMTGTAGTAGTAMTTSPPMMTGTPSHGNSTVMVTSTAPCHKGKCTSTPVPGAPTSTPTGGSGSGAGSGSGSGSGSGGGAAGNTPASPSATAKPNPGSKLAVPMAGAALGSVAYGLIFLA